MAVWERLTTGGLATAVSLAISGCSIGNSVGGPTLTAPATPTSRLPTWTCDGSWSRRDTHGPAVVPKGSVCRLDRVNQYGDVTVQPGGALHLTKTAVVGAVNVIQAKEFRAVDSTIGGDAFVRETRQVWFTGNNLHTLTVLGTPGPTTILRNVLAGDLVVRDNRGKVLCQSNNVKFMRVGQCSW